MGRSTCGPSPCTKSNGRPSGCSGKSRSEKMIAASSGKRRMGCSVTSAARSGVRHRSSIEYLGPQGSVLGHVAAGLAHEPDGSCIDRLSPAGAEEPVIHRGRCLQVIGQTGFTLGRRTCCRLPPPAAGLAESGPCRQISMAHRRPGRPGRPDRVPGAQHPEANCARQRCYNLAFGRPAPAPEVFQGGRVTPILVRPVREQLEHDRVIRLLQLRWKRKYAVGINQGSETTASVALGESLVYPDVVLAPPSKPNKPEIVVEVETGESVNNLEAMAEWVRMGQLKAAFHLYVPAGSVDPARRLCQEHNIPVAEIWTYHPIGDQMRFNMVYKAPAAPARRQAAPLPRAASHAAPVTARRSPMAERPHRRAARRRPRPPPPSAHCRRRRRRPSPPVCRNGADAARRRQAELRLWSRPSRSAARLNQQPPAEGRQLPPSPP